MSAEALKHVGSTGSRRTTALTAGREGGREGEGASASESEATCVGIRGSELPPTAESASGNAPNCCCEREVTCVNGGEVAKGRCGKAGAGIDVEHQNLLRAKSVRVNIEENDGKPCTNCICEVEIKNAKRPSCTNCFYGICEVGQLPHHDNAKTEAPKMNHVTLLANATEDYEHTDYVDTDIEGSQMRSIKKATLGKSQPKQQGGTNFNIKNGPKKTKHQNRPGNQKKAQKKKSKQQTKEETKTLYMPIRYCNNSNGS